MGKPSRRKNREAQKALRKKFKKSQRKVRDKINDLPGKINPRTQASNAKCPAQTLEEESAWRADAVGAQIKAWQAMLPLLLRRFSRIPDHRNPLKIKHKITVLMFYGLLSFIFQFASRREANVELSKPQFYETLLKLFPEFDSIHHVDTLYRFLKEIDSVEIEMISIALFRKLIKSKQRQQASTTRAA